MDLRYQTAFGDSSIARKARDIRRAMTSGEMPYLGTTMLDEAGVRLVLDYLESGLDPLFQTPQ